jgi:hypothetical protein
MIPRLATPSIYKQKTYYNPLFSMGFFFMGLVISSTF